MKKILLLALLVTLTGCEPSPKPKGDVKTDNTAYKVEVLFTDEEGYTVKRFSDNNSNFYRYYVTPGPASVSTTTPYGKTHVPETIPTAKSEAKP